jgi:hypothetical protein
MLLFIGLYFDGKGLCFMGSGQGGLSFFFHQRTEQVVAGAKNHT